MSAAKAKAPVPEKDPNARDAMRKVLVGTVVSNKMQKTIVVVVVDKTADAMYKKVVTRTKKYKVHDEKNECSVGDKVEIMETRPISKDKYFRLVRVVEKVK
jgi:small subunit ribosomal protein S17